MRAYSNKLLIGTIPGINTGAKQEEDAKSASNEGSASEPDHNSTDQDDDWCEYRTNNTLTHGYYDPKEEEFSFYKK